MKNLVNNFKKILDLNSPAQLTIVLLHVVFMAIAITTNFFTFENQQFTIQAQSFIEGKLNIDDVQSLITDIDMVKINDKYYWTLSPFPALVLIPFVYIAMTTGSFFLQGYLQIIFTTCITILCFKLAKKFSYSTTDALWLAFAFTFASTYLGIAFIPMSWYFSHSIAALLLFLALYEYFTKKRYLLIGLYLACTFATRFTAGIVTLFFLLEIVREKGDLLSKIKVKNITFLILPIIVSGVLQLYYNDIRFNNPFDNGYMNTIQHDSIADKTRDVYGLFRLDNIPMNIYSYILQTPTPIVTPGTYHLEFPYFYSTASGLSFLITSPIFLLIFFYKPKNSTVVNLWITSLLILFILFTYVYTGASQFGTRYVIDFLPLWFIILLYSIANQRLRAVHYLIIGITAFTNLFFLISGSIYGK
jgi:hypothetical protein